MTSLLAIGILCHAQCAVKLAGADAAAWAVVASLKQPDRPHPLRQLVERMARTPAIRLRAGVQIGDPRAGAVAFRGGAGQEAPQFVILIDDSWVGGGHAQSAAAALKLWGARHVAIFNVARVLNANWAPTSEFMATCAPTRVFDPLRCPWTEGQCPAQG